MYQITKRIKPSKKGLINIQNFDDNEWFKYCLVWYLHPADHHPGRIREIDKLFGDELDSEDIKFLVKIKDIHKIVKKSSIGISIFGYENKEKYQICVKKMLLRQTCWFIISRRKKHYVLIKDFNTFMYDNTLHSGKNIFIIIVWKV